MMEGVMRRGILDPRHLSEYADVGKDIGMYDDGGNDLACLERLYPAMFCDESARVYIGANWYDSAYDLRFSVFR